MNSIRSLAIFISAVALGACATSTVQPHKFIPVITDSSAKYDLRGAQVTAPKGERWAVAEHGPTGISFCYPSQQPSIPLKNCHAKHVLPMITPTVRRE